MCSNYFYHRHSILQVRIFFNVFLQREEDEGVQRSTRNQAVDDYCETNHYLLLHTIVKEHKVNSKRTGELNCTLLSFTSSKSKPLTCV